MNYIIKNVLKLVIIVICSPQVVHAEPKDSGDIPTKIAQGILAAGVTYPTYSIGYKAVGMGNLYRDMNEVNTNLNNLDRTRVRIPWMRQVPVMVAAPLFATLLCSAIWPEQDARDGVWCGTIASYALYHTKGLRPLAMGRAASMAALGAYIGIKGYEAVEAIVSDNKE